MATRRRPILTGLLAIGIAAGLGCGSGGSRPSGGDEGPGIAPLLQPEHLGYKHPHCADCHELPVAGHDATHPPDCAACHGGNGACDPNGLHSAHAHLASAACTTCHGDRHGYAVDADCAACHFADAGRDDTCGAPPPEPANGLRPASELLSGCYGWPEQPFTAENHAVTQVGLTAGAAAVDFTLSTPAGVPVTLADLLLTRPVLLVTGAFT